MQWAIIRTIFLKECLDTLRDRRAVIAMVAVPVLLYPALFVVGAQALIVQQGRVEAMDSRVAITGPHANLVRPWLKHAPEIAVAIEDDPEEALALGRIDAVVVTGLGESPEASYDSLEIIIQYDSVEQRSLYSLSRVREALQEKSRELLALRIAEVALPEGFAHPLTIQGVDTASTERRTGYLLGSMLPMLMVVMLGVGAFYPAIDLTAGEKERGTLETLLATPAGKLNIVWGKFLTVFLLCMITGLLNLGSMSASVLFQLGQLEDGFGEFGLTISPGMLLIALAAMVPLAFFVSAIMMALAVLARSFKEAQNFVTPFFVALLIPATWAAVPGVTLDTFNQFLPVANVALLFKALFLGEATAEGVFAVLVSTAAFALLALQFATWLFQQDEMLLAEDRGFAFLRRRGAIQPAPVPTPTAGLFLYAVVMLLLFYPATYLQQRELFSGLLATQWLFLLLPTLALVAITRGNWRETLALRMPGVASLGVVTVATGAWIVLQSQFFVWQQRVLPFPDALREEMERLFTTPDLSVWALLFIIAVTPAICEEVLFRGAILSSLRRRVPAWAAVLLVGVLFGLFHLSVHRLLLTTLSGILITWFVYRSRSLAHGVLAHLIVNGSAVLIVTGNAPAIVLRYLADPDLAETGLPLPIVAASAVVLAAALIVFARLTRGAPPANP